jgi:hypothetical protein
MGTPTKSMVVASALGHGIAGDRGGDAGGTGIDQILYQLQLALRRAAGLLGDLQCHAQVMGRGLGAVDDLLHEGVARGMGDEADDDGLVRAGRRRQQGEGRGEDRNHEREMASRTRHVALPGWLDVKQGLSPS